MEKELSLFQVDTGKEWGGGQRQSFFLVKELVKKGYPVHFIVQPDSPLYVRAEQEGFSVIPIRIKSEVDLGAAIKLSMAMKRKKCALVHFHDAYSLGIGATANKLKKFP